MSATARAVGLARDTLDAADLEYIATVLMNYGRAGGRLYHYGESVLYRIAAEGMRRPYDH